MKNSCSELFFEKGVPKLSRKFIWEHPCRSVISIKLLCNSAEIALRHECFLVTLLYILRTRFCKNTSGSMPLKNRVLTAQSCNIFRTNYFHCPYPYISLFCIRTFLLCYMTKFFVAFTKQIGDPFYHKFNCYSCWLANFLTRTTLVGSLKTSWNIANSLQPLIMKTIVISDNSEIFGMFKR